MSLLVSTEVDLGATVTTFAGLTSVTSTAFVGALTGNADTATTATTANGVAANSVALGTDTTGNYVATLGTGTGCNYRFQYRRDFIPNYCS